MQELPSNRPLERDVIASLAVSPSWMEYARDLTPEHFTDPEARSAISEMTRLRSEGRGWIDNPQDGEIVKWFTMGRQMAASFEFEEAVRQLQDVLVLRTAYLKGRELVVAAMKGEVGEVEALSEKIELPNRQRFGHTVEEIVADLTDQWGTMDNEIVPSGYRYFQKVLKRREGIGLAARPSMGKSQLAFQIAHNIVRAGGVVVVWSGEMHRFEVAHRVAGSMVGFSRWELDVMGREDTYQKALAELAALKGLIVEDKKLTSMEVWNLARRVKQEYGRLDLVIVDHIRLMGDRHEQERHRLGNITSNLRRMAQDLDCCSMMLIQLNRASENRKDKRPNLADLRDSGEIEENLDVVSFLYRDGYYTYRERESTDQSGMAEWYALKNRNGKLWGSDNQLYYSEQGPTFREVKRFNG